MKYRQFYEQWFSNLKPKESGECVVRCPFHHPDKNPSLSINLKTGVWNCFSCGIGEGAPVFAMKRTNCSMTEALRIISKLTGNVPEEKILIKQTKTISKAEISKYHELLLKTPEIMERLFTERGLNVATIKDFQLGWSPKEHRLYIPILNKNKDLINIRKYSFEDSGGMKMLSYKAGYGSAVLFPISKLKYQNILLCEGEMDCILANAIGYHAMSVTGGAGTWKDEWNEFFAGKKVAICYDIDDSGQNGARKVANNIADHAEEVKIINLPLDSPKNADLTDYLIGHGESKKDLDALIDRAIPFQKKLTPEEVLTKNVFDVHLSKASEAYYRNQIIRINVLVAGKDLAPYIVPSNIKAKCPTLGGSDKKEAKKCKTCSMVDNGGVLDISYELSEPGLLKFIANDEDQQMQQVRRKAGISSKCGTVILKIIESINIEELTLIPELNFSATDQEYVVRKAYYAGHGAKPNSSYTMTGITIPEPRTQYATHLIYQMIPSQDNISTFKLTKDIKEQLKIFQSNDIEAKFHEIAEDLSSNITRIYGREDLHWAIDLVYHSALNFCFQDKLINKGWLECLILGDTRCGKSQCVQDLMKHYKLGEFITGENSSYAGLIGGMQQAQKRWHIQWGKIALNDRRLVVIDEVSGLHEEDIGRMSGVRSSGIAEITKIQTERTHARTRLIWISNPRSNRGLNTYTHGVQAIKNLIGKPEDIARFDFALTAASEEVGLSEINKIEHEKIEHKYTSDLCRNLILWAWSREPENIEFSEAATKSILELATKMGQEYSSRIPLIEGADQRIKLAKLAVATACRVFSTDESGRKVIVQKRHVRFAYEYLEQIYSKPSLSYKDFSKQAKQDESFITLNQRILLEFIKDNFDIVEIFIQNECLRMGDVADMLGLEKTEIKSLIRFMVKNRMIKNTSRGYYKNPAFIKVLKQNRSLINDLIKKNSTLQEELL